MTLKYSVKKELFLMNLIWNANGKYSKRKKATVKSIINSEKHAINSSLYDKEEI